LSIDWPGLLYRLDFLAQSHPHKSPWNLGQLTNRTASLISAFRSQAKKASWKPE